MSKKMVIPRGNAPLADFPPILKRHRFYRPMAGKGTIGWYSGNRTHMTRATDWRLTIRLYTT